MLAMQFDFLGIANITAGLADDTFTFVDGGSMSGDLDGGSGTDTLDYSALTSPVIVDLNASTASHVSGSVSQIENVMGGSANDTLTGDNQANTLMGNDGDDTLDGGLGVDQLFGGPGDDVLVFDALDITAVDGGADEDALRLTDVNPVALVSQIQLTNIETIDMTDASAQDLTIAAGDVTSVSGGGVSLKVTGDGVDAVTLDGVWDQPGTTNIGGVDFNVYTLGGETVFVQDSITDVTVTGSMLMGSSIASQQIEIPDAIEQLNESLPPTQGNAVLGSSRGRFDLLVFSAASPPVEQSDLTHAGLFRSTPRNSSAAIAFAQFDESNRLQLSADQALRSETSTANGSDAGFSARFRLHPEKAKVARRRARLSIFEAIGDRYFNQRTGELAEAEEFSDLDDQLLAILANHALKTRK